MSTIDELKKLVGSEKLLLGTKEVLKNLKNNKITKIYLSSNCNEETVSDINHYSEILKNVELETLNMKNEEIGVLFKKSFSISVIGILR
jgi:ribosomal protein L30E